MTYAGRGADQFVVRLPDGMRDRLKKSATVNGRSMNAEILARIEASYPASRFELALAVGFAALHAMEEAEAKKG